jgi:hypothetical protein
MVAETHQVGAGNARVHHADRRSTLSIVRARVRVERAVVRLGAFPEQIGSLGIEVWAAAVLERRCQGWMTQRSAHVKIPPDVMMTRE